MTHSDPLVLQTPSLRRGWAAGTRSSRQLGGARGACAWGGPPAHSLVRVSAALCAIVATIWFPVCAHQETTIVSFGYSLYAGWIGAVLCLVGGCVILCCAGDAQAFGENRFYYSSGSSSPTHAKSAHV